MYEQRTSEDGALHIMTQQNWNWSEPWHLHSDTNDVPGLLVEAVRRAVDLRDALAMATGDGEDGRTSGLSVRAVMLVDVLNAALEKSVATAISKSKSVSDYRQASAWDIVASLRDEGLV